MFVVNLQSRHSKDYFKLEVGFGLFEYIYIYFYNHGSVHRDSIIIRSNKMQQYAGIYLLQNYSMCFGCPSHLSSGVHKKCNCSLWYRSYHVTVQEPSSTVA